MRVVVQKLFILGLTHDARQFGHTTAPGTISPFVTVVESPDGKLGDTKIAGSRILLLENFQFVKTLTRTCKPRNKYQRQGN